MNPAYEGMEYAELSAALLKNVSSGNAFPSDMLHTSKDFGKCKSLLDERKSLYNGRMVKIDLSASSQDDYIDLSILASYKVLFCWRRVFVDVLVFVGKSGVMHCRLYLCCFCSAGVCFAGLVLAGSHFYGFHMRSAIPPKYLFYKVSLPWRPSSPPLSPGIPSLVAPRLPLFSSHPRPSLAPRPLIQTVVFLFAACW